VVTSPSNEETTYIANENVRFKNFLEIGMFKILKGHQTLCDVLKKRIWNKNKFQKRRGCCSQETSMLMVPIGHLSNIPKLNGCSPKENLLIPLFYLDMIVMITPPCMSHLTLIINCLKNNMVKYSPDILELIAGMVLR
jgi:hypothetical protein